jgi:hypothetical protein
MIADTSAASMSTGPHHLEPSSRAHHARADGSEVRDAARGKYGSAALGAPRQEKPLSREGAEDRRLAPATGPVSELLEPRYRARPPKA